MGNYQEHVIQNKPLREVDPSQARVHTFGNPFKLKQDQVRCFPIPFCLDAFNFTIRQTVHS